jgi:hypothetical protein
VNFAQEILIIIKLVFGGLASFFAILLWSKTRDFAWMSLVIASLCTYAAIVYDVLENLGVIPVGLYTFYGISIASLFFAIVPSIFYIISFAIMLKRLSK